MKRLQEKYQVVKLLLPLELDSHTEDSPNKLTDPHKARFPLTAVQAWEVPWWLVCVCINQPPGGIKGMTEKTDCKGFST